MEMRKLGSLEVSLVGVGCVLLKERTASGPALAGMTGLSGLSVLVAWGVVQTVFTLRYADLYYSTGDGIDFNDDAPPDYRDFAYLAFTIGMTFQVSDTDLTSSAMRRIALRHSLLSYLFGAVILASMVNVTASFIL